MGALTFLVNKFYSLLKLVDKEIKIVNLLAELAICELHCTQFTTLHCTRYTPLQLTTVHILADLGAPIRILIFLPHALLTLHCTLYMV